MESRYNITINIRTPDGMMEIGNFFIGNNHDFAHTTFNSLRGNQTEQGILRIDLVEKVQYLQEVKTLKSITCSLDQYTENCRLITRDVFKFFTLECKDRKPRYGIKGIADQANTISPPLISNLSRLNAVF